METRELAVHYIVGELNFEDELEMRLAREVYCKGYNLSGNVLDKIFDLLEEYGEDNDLPEGWWQDEGSIEEDWFYWIYDAIDWENFKHNV